MNCFLAAVVLSLCREHESHSASACPAPASPRRRRDRVLRTAMGRHARMSVNRSRSVIASMPGVNKIPCQYCHAYAAQIVGAGRSAVARCVGCHGNESPKVESSRSLVHGPTTRSRRSKSSGTACTRCPTSSVSRITRISPTPESNAKAVTDRSTRWIASCRFMKSTWAFASIAIPSA